MPEFTVYFRHERTGQFTVKAKDEDAANDKAAERVQKALDEGKIDKLAESWDDETADVEEVTEA